MSPVGGVAVPWTGNTGVSSVTVNSGWLGIDGGGFTNTGKVFTSSTTGITLNGGGLAVFAGGVPLGGGTNITDAIVIGTKGGSLDSDGTGGSSGVVSGGGTLAPPSNTSPVTQTVNFSGNITGTGPLNLISGRQADGNGGIQYGAILVLLGNQLRVHRQHHPGQRGRLGRRGIQRRQLIGLEQSHYRARRHDLWLR